MSAVLKQEYFDRLLPPEPTKRELWIEDVGLSGALDKDDIEIILDFIHSGLVHNAYAYIHKALDKEWDKLQRAR